MKSDSNHVFDQYASDYDAALSTGLALSGEDRHYFAQRRIAWLKERLNAHQLSPGRVMDFGCGNGSSSPWLMKMLGADALLGTDSSQKSLEIATKEFGAEQIKFAAFDQYQPDASFDLVYSNGVFHHIPLPERYAALSYVFRSLRPGGIFAFWENNPWNPGTRLVMSRIPFDRDAITISAPEARTLLRSSGFDILHTDFLFIFPNVLRWFRWIEAYSVRLPVGAQYQVFCRKPTACQ